MLAKEIIEDNLLSFLTKEALDIEVDREARTQKVLPKIKVGPSSLALLAKIALMAKYVCKGEGKRWTHKEAKSMISKSVEMSQLVDSKELEKLANEQSKMYPLGPTIALVYLSVLKDCEVHCFKEGSKVKKLSGLHLIGASLHESRRIDNQDEMFRKFNFDTEWAVRLISRITNDEDLPIEGFAIVKQVQRKHVYDLRQSILMGDNASCSQYIFQYMQAVVDEIVFANVDPLQHPTSWSLGKLLKEFNLIGGKLLDDSFAGITEETLLRSLE